MHTPKMADLRYVTELKVLSYNMRGCNQGRVAMDDLIDTVDPDIFLCREHLDWWQNLKRGLEITLGVTEC